MAVTWIKMTLYCSAVIFMKDIPSKTACCLSGASFMLFRNRQRKIAEQY